jgi:hypothetical protein
VIDAFHVVNLGDVPVRFFFDERRQSAKGIRLTDDLRRVREDFRSATFPPNSRPGGGWWRPPGTSTCHDTCWP